jgi:hypothetical protein
MSSVTGRKMERLIMIRISFDPIMEAERQHQELIKQISYEHMLRQAREASPSRTTAGSRILALIGREMASAGLRLAERYGDESDTSLDLISRSDLKPCS